MRIRHILAVSDQHLPIVPRIAAVQIIAAVQTVDQTCPAAP